MEESENRMTYTNFHGFKSLHALKREMIPEQIISKVRRVNRFYLMGKRKKTIEVAAECIAVSECIAVLALKDNIIWRDLAKKIFSD